MCSVPLDLFSMLELGGQQPSNAMVAMNQVNSHFNQSILNLNIKYFLQVNHWWSKHCKSMAQESIRSTTS